MSADEYYIDESFVLRTNERAADYHPLTNLLGRLYLAESTTFVRYLENWSPYTDARTVRFRSAVRRMIQQGRERSDHLSNLIDKLGGGEAIEGEFPDAFARFNYAAWPTMVPLLVDGGSEIVALYETILARLAHVEGGEYARAMIEEFADQHRRDIEVLINWRQELAV